MEPEVPIPSLLKGLEHIRKKRKICKKIIDESLNNVISVLEDSVEEIMNTKELEDDPEKLNRKVKDITGKLMEMKPLHNVVDGHKGFYTHMSKFGKCTDKAFNKGVNKVFNLNTLDKKLLNKAIYQHFLHRGNFQVSDILKKELKIRYQTKLEKNFRKIHKIVQEILKYNLDPAIDWALENEDSLEETGSDLPFSLYQQKFIHEMTTKDKKRAIDFARKNFTKFFPKYASNVQRLMGSLLYGQGYNNPRYADLFDTKKWEEVSKQFFKEACKIYGITPQSTLCTLLEAGTLTLPGFLKYHSLSPECNWNEEEELPIAIEAGKDYHFHSVFVCPVSKEKCDEENPPIALTCGHVISMQALKKILSQKRPRYKCPYCPSEISLAELRRLYFE